jgi:hypothetical protein
MAATARRAAPGLSQAPDRLAFLEHAQELEGDATGLDAQAEIILEGNNGSWYVGW